MARERVKDQTNMRQVYDAAAPDFRAVAPVLLTYKYIVRPAIERALAKFFPTDRRSTAKVLDVGSASGRNVHTLMEAGFLAHHILGVEISPEQVAIAAKDIPQARFEVGDISTHRLTANQNDLVIMIMVGEFLDDQRYPTALRKIYDSMTSDGCFIYVTTHPDRYQAKYGVSQGQVTTAGPWDKTAKFANYVRTVNQQADLFRAAGFEVDLVEELDMPSQVDASDTERRAQFDYADSHARLVIIARKP